MDSEESAFDIDHRPSTIDSVMKHVLLSTIRLYQRLFSPMLLPACRYVPTCSQYAADALELHGLGKGSLLAAWRLLRCHPFARGGFDPVPSKPHQPCAMAHHEIGSSHQEIGSHRVAMH